MGVEQTVYDIANDAVDELLAGESCRVPRLAMDAGLLYEALIQQAREFGRNRGVGDGSVLAKVALDRRERSRPALPQQLHDTRLQGAEHLRRALGLRFVRKRLTKLRSGHTCILRRSVVSVPGMGSRRARNRSATHYALSYEMEPANAKIPHRWVLIKKGAMLTKIRIGTMMLALGLTVGSGTTMLLRPAAIASAQQSMANMKMGSKSVGDTEMNAAMSRMMQKMSAMKLTGTQDRDFMMMMIPHHQSAVDMAKIELRRGAHPELKSLARNIIKSQEQEIGQMQSWLKTWYGQTP